MQTSSISSKGQVVIPKPLRDKLGLRPGAEVEFFEEGSSLRMAVVKRSAVSSSVSEGLGLAGYKGPRISEADIRAAIRKKAGQHG